MKYPKISVITPSYNQGVFLERTILSILNQNYPNLEYIVCDGGSTDNSIDIIKKYEDKITWWCSEKDSGQSNAINKGFKKATGDIVCWINSDDILLDGALEKYAYLHNTYPDCSIYMGQTMRIDNNDNIIFFHMTPKPYSFFYRNGIIGMAQQSWAWKRKEVFNKIGYLNEERHACMDIEFLMRQIRAGFKFAYTRDTLGAIRIYEGTKTSIDNQGGNNIWTKDREILKKEFADFRYRNVSPIAYFLYRIFKIINGMSIRSYYLTQMYKGCKYSKYIIRTRLNKNLN